MNLEEKMLAVFNDIRTGVPVIIVDSYERENEGDLMIAAEHANVRNLAYMALNARGIMCLPCTADRLERLQIPMMYSNNLDKFSTPFANSIDASRDISTGVPVKDRLKAIELFLSEESKPEDFTQPGHLFPLRAREGLLKERQGHTEASIELCLQAGVKPVAVIIEIMRPDGDMMRMEELTFFARNSGFKMISIDEIKEYIYGNGNQSV